MPERRSDATTRRLLSESSGRIVPSGSWRPAPDRVRGVLIAGVGGQGILLASGILARAAMMAGHDVKTNEVHGMAQRGGSVVAEIRFGKKVHSPLISRLDADVMASLEEMEALRHANYLAPGGVAVVSTLRLTPASVSSGLARNPGNLDESLRKAFPNLRRVDMAAVAERTGSGRAVNLAVLGAVSAFLDFGESIWLDAVRHCVKPAFLDLNLAAFALGREMAA